LMRASWSVKSLSRALQVIRHIASEICERAPNRE
jgi:hypothetical protein